MSFPADLDDREYGFVTEQYRVLAFRVNQYQSEREQWIRTSILATSAYFGWVTTSRDEVSMAFMLGSNELRIIDFLPVVFNLGGALRFFFIQRDINRISNYLIRIEREILCLPDHIVRAADGQGLRDRHWHMPSIFYWATVSAVSLAASLFISNYA